MILRHLYRLLMVSVLVAGVARAGLREDYEASEFEFVREEFIGPSIPFAWVGYNGRDDTTVELEKGTRVFDQSSASEFLALPVWIGRRDMVLAGEYVSMTRFSPVDRVGPGADVYSTGFGSAWVRQASPDWQYAAGLVPFGSSGMDDESSWTWQVFGGAGVAYYGQPDLLWIFAGIVDYTEEQTYVLPYVGFSWTLTPQWVLSMILPWPVVTYAPTSDLIFNVGAVPSGGTWRLDEEGEDLSVSLRGWDVGAGAEYRLWNACWLYTRVGMCGFRGLQIAVDGDVDGIEAEPDAQPFVSAGLSLRL